MVRGCQARREIKGDEGGASPAAATESLGDGANYTAARPHLLLFVIVVVVVMAVAIDVVAAAADGP